MDLIGSRAMDRGPTTIAVIPSHKLLAVATAAAGGDSCVGGSSRIDLVRLWREEEEQELRRPLEAVASYRDCGGVAHRLAWSRGGATSQFPLGLLAAGLDGGAVHIWDPSRLSYEPNIDTGMERDVACSDAAGLYSSCPLHVFINLVNGGLKSQGLVEERPEMKFEDKRIEEAAADMHSKLNCLILEHAFKERPSKVELQSEMKHHDSEDDWEIIQKEEIVPKVLSEDIGNGIILKLNHLNGPVLGLSFNCHYKNMLACAAYGEKIRIYYLDFPDEFACRGNDKLNTQMTFLEWNPFYPAVLATATDIGVTKIWDLRERSSKCTYQQDSDRPLSCSEVHWNPCDPLMFAVASKVNCEYPIKIWDARFSKTVLYQFGNAKGVTSFSWSTSGLITTSDIDGVINCWKRDGLEGRSSWTSSAGGFREVHWCQSDTTLAAVSSNTLEVYRTPADQCVWPRRRD